MTGELTQLKVPTEAYQYKELSYDFSYILHGLKGGAKPLPGNALGIGVELRVPLR
jgi:hypothetical protein